MCGKISSPDQLARCIRAVRVAAGLRQADAAALCGVSERFLNDLENGKPSAQLEQVLRVCKGLGITLELIPPMPIATDAPVSMKRGRKAARK